MIANGWTHLVVRGAYPDLKVVNIFGRNSVITTTTTPEDIWNQGGLYPFASFDATAENVGLIMYASSTEAADTEIIKVWGLDENWVEQTKTVNLAGDSQVKIDGQWKRVFRACNANGTATAGDVYIAESDTLSGGIPVTVSKIKSKMDQAQQCSYSCFFTVPAGKIGYWADSYATLIQTAGTPTAKAVELHFRRRTYGKILNSVGQIGLMSVGSSIWNRPRSFPAAFPERTDLIITAQTATADVDVGAGFSILLEDGYLNGERL